MTDHERFSHQDDGSERVHDTLSINGQPSKKRKREPLRRPSGKRGGVKNRRGKANDSIAPSSLPQSGRASRLTSDHAEKIAQFHTLEKQLARTDDPQQRRAIRAQQAALGGLQAYQDASLVGGDKQRGGETGKWCAQQLMAIRDKRGEKLRLLDVGAISGTAYHKYPWIEPTSIDLNPRSERVQQYDFFDFPAPADDHPCYDVIGLSLVINFVGGLADRGRMLLHAHRYTPHDRPAYLFLVLPLACVQNSRYLDHDRLRAILASCGWADVVAQHDSARLTHWLCRETAKQGDGRFWKKEEIRKGATLNNYCIVMQ